MSELQDTYKKKYLKYKAKYFNLKFQLDGGGKNPFKDVRDQKIKKEKLDKVINKDDEISSDSSNIINKKQSTRGYSGDKKDDYDGWITVTNEMFRQ